MTSVLDALGPLPGALITLDFETYYSAEYTLKKLTTEAYVRDARFEVIGVGVKVGAAPSVWMEAHDFATWAAGIPWERVAVLAQHAHFEGLILSHHYGIRPGFWIDTLSMDRALRPGQPHDLATMARAYGVGEKGHEVHDAKGKRRRDFTEAEWLKYGGYCNNDNALQSAIGQVQARKLPREELWLIDTTVRMFSEPSFVADQDVLRRALEGEREKKRRVLTRVAQNEGVQLPDDATEAQALEAARATLSSSDKFAALLRSMDIEPPTKKGKNGTIFAFAKSDPGMQALLEHADAEIRGLAEARLTVKSTIIETRTERFAAAGRRGKIGPYLKYCGPHTHRWSGGDKSNWQNLNRGGDLRASICADEGETLVVADSSQIEARKVAWLAGETAILDTFRRLDALGYDEHGEPRGDFYSDRGSVYFGKAISKKTHPVERQTAKSMELGLGFGMGWFSFAAGLLKGFLGAPPVQFTREHVAQFGVDVRRFRDEPLWRDGPTGATETRRMLASGARLKTPGDNPLSALLIHCAVTHHLVRLYRATNARIAGAWKMMDELLPLMAEDGGRPDEVRQRFGPRGCLAVMRHAIRKPNGMVLRYQGLRLGEDGYEYWGHKNGRNQWVSVYGGLLVENIVQSLARDVVAEQALWCRAAGYRIGTTTHDEIVSVVPEAMGPAALGRMLSIMRTAPTWCADLPLNAAGGFAKSYGSVK